MIDVFNNSLFYVSIILLLSVLLSKSSNRFGLPILILFLGIGMFIGNEGFIGLEYQDYQLTHSLSLIAICLIIFSGGIMTRSEDIKPIIKTGISLSTLGVLITTFLVGTLCYFYLKLPIYESLLIGSILSSTDAAAVFTAFRDKDSNVSKNLKSVIEFESGSNDPMAFLLVSLFLGLHQSQLEFGSTSLQMIILNPLMGLAGGYFIFKLFLFINDSIKLDFQGLYPALTIGFLFLTYSLTTKLEGNGFLAVYIFALQLGNAKIVHKNALINFFDGVSWLSQIGLFIMLGLLVVPSRLADIAPEASVIALFLVFIGRPLSVFLSTMNSNFDFKNKFFISWAGLKGATPIVFASLVATQLGSAANLIFDIVFFTVLISALLQGTTLKFTAKKLDLLFEAIYDPDFPIDMEVLDKTKHGIKEILINKDDFAVGNRIIDLHLPEGASVLFIKRSGGFILPNGSTRFESADKILAVTTEKSTLEEVVHCFKIEKDLNPQSLLDDEVALETEEQDTEDINHEVLPDKAA